MVVLIQASQLKYQVWGSKYVSHWYQSSDGLFSLVQKICSPFCSEEGFNTSWNTEQCQERQLSKAHHDFPIKRSLPIKVEMEQNSERWNCRGDFMDYKPVPELFKSHGKMLLIYGNCLKMGENYPLHYFFQKRSKDWRMQKLHIVTDPNMIIQETI